MNFQLTDDQQTLAERADELAQREFAPTAAQWDRDRQYPVENVEVLRGNGFLGMTIPRRYGGSERSLLDAILVIEQVSKYCATTGRILVETNMGALGAVMAYGAEEQQKLIADRILQHGDKPTIGMTEPDAGTDLTSLKTTARLEEDEIVVNGKKHWITGGGVATTNLVFARIVEDNGTDHGIGAVLVDTSTPGFDVVSVENQLGVCAMPEATIHFDDCRVPKGNLVLRDAENGFKRLMQAYNAQRIGASAVAVGIAQGAHDLAAEYMLEREQFDQPISDFQGLRWKMAEAEMELHAARVLMYRAAANANELQNNMESPNLHETSIAKAYCADASFEIVNDCLQMFGAIGYGDAVPLERMLRDVRMFKIGGGTTEAQRNMIARNIFQRAKDRDRRLLDSYSIDSNFRSVNGD